MLPIKTDEQLQKRFFLHAFGVLVFLLVCRIITDIFTPLNDATEARYGEIARKMLETGNWVTLQHDYGVPFWAKPPLSTWLSALSMKLFGVNEFAVRLPALVLSIAIVWLIWNVAKKHSGSIVAMISTVVLAGTLFFFLDAGTVMTDPSLMFCTTLSTVAFWHALVYHDKLWSYLFFVGLGLGLLAKGPLVLVLVGMPLLVWVFLRKEWRNVWRRLPWIKGILILSVIALPWYVLAEIRTPGFLNYFIIGEHVNRFLIPGWTGDKYGMAHDAPKGMIWIYALMGIFPWNIFTGVWLVKHRKKRPFLYNDEEGWLSFLLIFMLTPLVFFSFASNIIYPYVFPILPVFALFFSEIWYRSCSSIDSSKSLFAASIGCGLMFLGATLVFIIKPEVVAKTQKNIIAQWIGQHPHPESNLVYWGYKTEFSAQFYSAGKAKFAQNTESLCKLLSNHKDNYLIINSTAVSEIPQELFARFSLVNTTHYKEVKMLLMRCPVLTC